MAKSMLIDAMHAEETRVVVLNGSQLEHFDFESANKKQLKGNIYLAKVTRVEPSLQAAFIDYGGNRHGFLSFSEIHPDYYQIPIADREALIAEDASAAESDDDADEIAAGAATDDAEPDAVEEPGDDDRNTTEDESGDSTPADSHFDEIGGDEVEEIEIRHSRPHRNYRIQEVIKRRQVLLVQVVKEERGTKGAALTSYLSLAGRYCVLMPNSSRGGGISRKIANPEDRKRLRTIANDLPVAEGIGVILRTAGLERTKAEIKRDFSYLAKLWESIRQLTFESAAPTLIHEEASLISRTLRDLYSKDIEEVLIEGESGYRLAKEFMRMLTPSHARRIKSYNETIPLFHRFQVESMLDAFHSPTVRLKSGGYIVINPTEALVAIDVNSGRATRERNIEETATKTNLEAAEEISRQLRLRDLAGLIVIDFIDMENSRNVRNVERCMKEAMKGDRARIQLGSISHFGLMEMSRQRLRSSLLEASSEACHHCDGSGHIRSTESTALHVLRAIEEEGILARNDDITVHVPGNVALYILNQKRSTLIEIEKRYDFTVTLESDDSLIPPDYRLDRTRVRPGAEASEGAAEADGERSGRKRRRRRSRGQRDDEIESQSTADTGQDAEVPEALAADAGDEDQPREVREAREAKDDNGEGGGVRKRRRRGKRGGRRRRRGSGDQPATPEINDETGVEAASDDSPADATVTPADGDQPPPPETDAADTADTADAAAAAPEEAPEKPRRSRRKPAAKKADAKETKKADATKASDGDEKEAKPKKPRRSRRKTAKPDDAQATPPIDDGNGSSPAVQSAAEAKAEEILVQDIEVPVAVPETVAVEAEAPKATGRKGWWNRLTS
ncbi:MAG: ribonuclease E/G [Alphaproteobacteria bacterium]